MAQVGSLFPKMEWKSWWQPQVKLAASTGEISWKSTEIKGLEVFFFLIKPGTPIPHQEKPSSWEG